MFETQKEWCHCAESQDGTALGVSGTPTFFVGGKLIEPSSLEEFEQLVKDAIVN